MARRRLKSRLLSASSELRKGFAIPTKKKVFSALRGRSKTFIMELFWSAFIKLPKSAKITLLMRIDRIKSKRKTRRKSKGRRKSKARKRRKSRGRSSRRRKSKTRRKKGRTAKQRAATRKLVAFNRRR